MGTAIIRFIMVCTLCVEGKFLVALHLLQWYGGKHYKLLIQFKLKRECEKLGITQQFWCVIQWYHLGIMQQFLVCNTMVPSWHNAAILVCNTMVPSLVKAKVHQLNELNIEKWHCYQPRMVSQKTLTKTILGLAFYSDKTDWLMLCKFPDPMQIWIKQKTRRERWRTESL